MPPRRFLALAVLAAAAAAIPLVSQPHPDFRFAILGDRTGRANDAAYRQIWREIERSRPAFVINTGDSIEGGDDSRAEGEWAGLRRLWQRVPYPLYCTPGNHDIWSESSRALFEKATGRPPAYSFDYQDAHFTVLDNSRTEDLAPEQLRFLEEDLKAHAARGPKFIFFHRPHWILFLKLGSGEFPLHRLARKYGAAYVISGHLHQFLSMHRDGILYVAAGSAGGGIERGTSRGQGFAQGWFYGYLLAAVAGGKAELTVHEIGPPLGQGRRVRVAEWERAAARAGR